MKLSVELFQKTIQHLKGETGSGRVEKRSAPRMGLRVKILLKAMGPSDLENSVEVWTRDISRVGLGVMSARKLEIGDHYLLAIPHEAILNQEKPLALYCTVRTCHAVTEQSYVVGLSFEDMRSKQFPKSSRTTPKLVQVDVPVGDQERIRRSILD